MSRAPQDSRSTGVVRSFSPEKGFGFIQGDDGKSYFVHASSVDGGEVLVDGQKVTFTGEPTAKGYKAKKVTPGDAPLPLTKVYSHPKDFMWLRGDVPKGMEYVFEVQRGLWAKSNDPNEARALLINLAKSCGANALVNIQVTKLTESDGCSNYHYTVHHFYGDAACVMKVGMSRDPAVIDASDRWYLEMDERLTVQSQPGTEPGKNATSLVRPGPLNLAAMQLWSWTLTIGKILFLTGKFLFMKAKTALDERKQNKPQN